MHRSKLSTVAAASALLSYTLPLYAAAPTNEEMYNIIQQQNQRIESLENELHKARGDEEQDNQQALESKVDAQQKQIEALADRDKPNPALLDRVKIGGYGSVRGEVTNLDNQRDTFTYRRFVLSADAQINDRLQTYLELEFERFTQLELEKSIQAGDGQFSTKEAIEGSNGSEISIEQAWAGYSISPALNLQAGIVLVPLGRFNINHDDNQWNLTRRSLVDKGVPVLPSSAAFSELGIGFNGALPVGNGGLLDYRFYVVNGAQLDFASEQEFESVQGGAPETAVEVEFAPSRGSASSDLNDNKAVTGRVAYRWQPGQEIALSGYWGRYTPDFLTDADVTSIGIDGLNTVGGLEIEYEAIYTDWGNVKEVAQSFARNTFNRDGQGAEVAIAGDSLADSRSGYWIELRYPFWPEALNNTFLKTGFAKPELDPTLRFEQVFFNNQLRGFEFANSNITEYDSIDATLSRVTLGMSYRPVPQWVITVAGEYTWTNQRSLAGLTNFLAAGPNEDDAFALTTGVAFGF